MKHKCPVILLFKDPLLLHLEVKLKTVTIIRIQEDNFSDISVCITNPQVLAYNRSSMQLFGVVVGRQGNNLPELHDITFYFLKVSCLFTGQRNKSILSLPMVDISFPSAQWLPLGMICSRKQAASMLFFPTLAFFGGVQDGVIFTRCVKRKSPSEKGKNFPEPLNPLFTSDKESPCY